MKRQKGFLFGQMTTNEINTSVTTHKYSEINFKNTAGGNNSLPSVFVPEIAVLAYFTADSTALSLETELVLVGHQQRGCLLALAGLL